MLIGKVVGGGGVVIVRESDATDVSLLTSIVGVLGNTIPECVSTSICGLMLEVVT